MGGVRHQRDTEQPTLLVLNASPIIYLCKAGISGKLRGLKPSFRLLTSDEVYEEVYVKGIEKGVSEASALKELFEEGIIEVEPPPKEGSKKVKEISKSAGIHPGEASVISYALALNATAIIDDKRARQVARVLGVRLSGTPGLIIELVRRSIISKDDAKRALEKMVNEGWYCSAKLFSSIIKTIENEQEAP
jgi:predicted nucleic acid-binding protein